MNIFTRKIQSVLKRISFSHKQDKKSWQQLRQNFGRVVLGAKYYRANVPTADLFFTAQKMCVINNITTAIHLRSQVQCPGARCINRVYTETTHMPVSRTNWYLQKNGAVRLCVLQAYLKRGMRTDFQGKLQVTQ